MVRVLCVANQQRAVGKTTTAINLAAGLARAGQRTLRIDLESGRQATDSPRQDFGVEILPGSGAFGPAGAFCDDVQTQAVRDHLRRTAAEYDHALLDCPSSLGQLTQLALNVSDAVLIPITGDPFALEGMNPLIQTIRTAMHRFPGQLEFGGVVLTMYDQSREFATECERQVRDFFGGIVFETVIPRDAIARDALDQGRSVMDYAPRSRAARAYIELCMEVLERE